MAAIFPDYDNLPPVAGMPRGCAWGVFDSDGKKDVYGCLNKINSKVIQEATLEATEGVSISLNWGLGALNKPGANRKGLEHTVKSFLDTPLNFHGYDDEVSFNTQCSSQWDSLCHYYHQDSECGYNGSKPSTEDLVKPTNGTYMPTLNHWHERGGLVGRGILIDFKSFAEAKGIAFNPFDDYRITPDQLEAAAEYQGLEFKEGDICLIRTGFTELLTDASAEEQSQLLGINKAAGVDPTEDSARWLWNKHFSAVASDNIAFETKLGPGRILHLHQYLLSLFGLHIGELWDLKALAEHCARRKRYSFLLTSCPLNVPGLIGSPPNALAIF
ncbi:hypothetical protein BJY01DRAFT_235450 [Aspergillus pseudoustus]|uniref:Cyclase-domain-containing protein n=1 Tax=Aspergillus pseudoustus TaxID=1810923 RepID=A0ABR4JVP0_9EURO